MSLPAPADDYEPVVYFAASEYRRGARLQQERAPKAYVESSIACNLAQWR